ncbi:MAG TPA: pyridoxal-phosphate dependent enzyme [Gemmatimonadaceae bacterium]|nr:pyridoxal-phosphate dependent enzyme [Gemmatimonadaceae bacterium]
MSVPRIDAAPAFPLVERFPALGALPRAPLTECPSPVERVEVEGASLWLKRDDLNAPTMGGNKVRALEFLLGAVRPGDRVLTVGGEGSTHVLATAAHAARLGAHTIAVRWPHEMHPTARVVAEEAARRCVAVYRASLPGAVLRVAALRLRDRHLHWVPFGGSSPLGIVGHVNAALELAEQVRAGQCEPPRRVVVPVGSGGTAAGLLLGFAIAGLEVEVVGVRVGPRIGVREARVLGLAHATRQFLQRRVGAALAPIQPAGLRIVHDWYGGAYGRPHPAGTRAADLLLPASGAILDPTYAAKAGAAALALSQRADGATLLWVTFDGRGLASGERGATGGE